MSCLPGMPCYTEIIYTTSQQDCGCGKGCKDSCKISSSDITYIGPNLPETGIQTLDDLTTAIEKIDEKMAQLVQLITRLEELI